MNSFKNCSWGGLTPSFLPTPALLTYILPPLPSAPRAPQAPFRTRSALNWKKKNNTATELSWFLPGSKRGVSQQRVQCVSAWKGVGLTKSAVSLHDLRGLFRPKWSHDYLIVPKDEKKEKMEGRGNPFRLARSSTAAYKKHCDCYSHAGFI